MDTQVYQISDAFIQKTRRTYLYMLILVPIGMLLLIYFIPFNKVKIEDLSFPIGLFIGCTVFIELEIFIVSRMMLKKVKENTITIGADFLQRTGKEIEGPIEFTSIKKLHVKKEKNGEIAYIDLKTSSQTVRLYGFEDLHNIWDLLIAQASQAEIKENNYKLDYNHPIILIVVFFATLLATSILPEKYGISISEIICLLLGAWLLLFKPISKAQGKRFRILELVLGISIIVCFVISIVISFFS